MKTPPNEVVIGQNDPCINIGISIVETSSYLKNIEGTLLSINLCLFFEGS